MSSDLWRVSLFYSNNFCVPITFTNSSFPPRIISMPKKSPNVPLHVAIVPDGNRRWAKKRGLRPWEGHFAGGTGKNPEEVAQTAIDEGVKYLTIWLGSYENLTKRSSGEIRMLNKVYQAFIKKMLDDKRTSEKGIRVRFTGEWKKLLEPKTVELINRIQTQTKKHSKHHLTALLGYNGDREMVAAIKDLLKRRVSVTDANIRKHLWTADLPPVDLVIRTGVEGDPHNSTGFMMWHTRDSQLYFSSKLWPDFTKNDLKLAIKDYQTRERRLGK